MFCISIFNKDYKELKKLNLTPVGLGSNKFSKGWLSDKDGKNISKKNLNFGEYTFHYNLWKNQKSVLSSTRWIGFCTYRRFWTKKEIKLKNFNDLKKVIILKPQKKWEKYDVVLGKPLVFKKFKNIKLIKRNFFEVAKNPKMLFKDTTLEEQFRVFHGSFFLDKAIELMSPEHQVGFKKYLSGHKFYPFNMFICKNYQILIKFYDDIFPWLLRCEKVFKKKNLNGYEKIRIYTFLAERFMPYWFIKKFKTTTCSISFLKSKSNLKN